MPLKLQRIALIHRCNVDLGLVIRGRLLHVADQIFQNSEIGFHIQRSVGAPQ